MANRADGLESVEIVDCHGNGVTRRPVHPGEILADELEAIGLSSAELARTLEPHLANHCRKAVDHR
jgi:hypothetical protein